MVGEAKTGWQPMNREVVFEMLDQAGEDWQETAILQIQDAEQRSLAQTHDVYPGKSKDVKAVVSGLMEHLYKTFGDDDDTVYLRAMGLLSHVPQEHHSWAFIAELAAEFADMDKIDRAQMMCITDGPVQEEYQPYVFLSIAKGYARRGDDVNTLKGLELAYMASFSGNIFMRYPDEVEEVFRVKKWTQN